MNLDGGYDGTPPTASPRPASPGLQYVHLDVDGFNERAPERPASPSAARAWTRCNPASAAAWITTSPPGKTGSFAAELHAAWQHEYLNHSRGISASFEGSGLAPFSVQTSAPQRDAAVVGLGLNFTFHDRLTLFADYELLLWSSSYFEQTINGGARISF